MRRVARDELMDAGPSLDAGATRESGSIRLSVLVAADERVGCCFAQMLGLLACPTRDGPLKGLLGNVLPGR